MPFSWEFWAKDSEGLYHLALIIAGVIGIPLLAIRTFAANRSASASLEQAKAANQSAAAALEQAKTAADQAGIASKRHVEQTMADRERRITESFAKAVEQLGSDKQLATRLGGIYTLEHISQESREYYWPIIETLTAYVRKHAPWQPSPDYSPSVLRPPGGILPEITNDDTEQAPKLPEWIAFYEHIKSVLSDADHYMLSEEPEDLLRLRPATEIQAVLTVLGRRHKTALQQDQEAGRRLDLGATDLSGAVLGGAHLENAVLGGAHLEGAVLGGAHLEGAVLVHAHLERAVLGGAHLEGAVLVHAHLERSKLRRAHLERAHFLEAHLENAVLAHAHLEDADLLGAHLEGADLGGAHLKQTNLLGAHLENANLGGAHLENANLGGAHLEGAVLGEAHLENANLRGAHLKGANLRGAHLKDSNLRRAHLEGAVNLTQQQLNTARGDEETMLPAGLTPPAHWSSAPPDAPDNSE